MSMGDADAKFPNQSSGAIPPSPSRENPGAVYPKSDPKAAPSESVPGTGGAGVGVGAGAGAGASGGAPGTTQEGPLFTD
ncbi:hypothetical protein PsYK624_091050 [Phanerochaete sordida]|uniref:Uncharacterized protein n=1 Tax=Phanerochaete sordida TaxID=48140 RepID=A0A9P3GDK1_9APHY|nr:hypothetical protein PsYK624_091050 [Phanerochaete sordida]